MSNCVFDNFSGPNNQPANFPNGIRIGTGGAGAVNNIGVAGQPGFGVGICPGPLPSGVAGLSGYTDPMSDNYGNYVDASGSVMVWIPAFYYKYGNGTNGLTSNAVDIKPFNAFDGVSSANASGYALHRAFYDGGVRDGVFVDKFACSNSAGNNVSGGIFVSVKNGVPCDTDGSQSGVGAILGVGGINNYGRVQQAAKSRGANYHSISVFIAKALALLSLAHANASTNTAFCAWYLPTANFPKGCNNNALGDTNDPALSFASAGSGANPGKNRAGSANLFARTTHNGQNCGVSDVNGTIWNVAFGLTSDGTNYYALKPSVRMRDLTGNDATSSTSFFGSAGITANYDSLGATIGQATASNSTKIMGSTLPVLYSDVSGANWQAAGAGIPINVGGTNQFGNDGFFDFRPNEMCPLVGAHWDVGSSAGVWALNLNVVRTFSGANVGGRAALYL